MGQVKYGAIFPNLNLKIGTITHQNNFNWNSLKTFYKFTEMHQMMPAELNSAYSLCIIQKRAIKFWHHLNKADQNSLNYKKALLSNRSSQDNVALDQVALRLPEQSNIKNNESQSQIPNQNSMKKILKTVDRDSKSKYTEHWKNELKYQNKLHCYQALNRNIKLAAYLKNDRKTNSNKI